jgi:hypothetical protein
MHADRRKFFCRVAISIAEPGLGITNPHAVRT